jgi:hypothetical protein
MRKRRGGVRRRASDDENTQDRGRNGQRAFHRNHLSSPIVALIL